AAAVLPEPATTQRILSAFQREAGLRILCDSLFRQTSEKQVCEYSAIHYFVSSSLPNCCELFAMAIAVSPFFNCAIHAVTTLSRSFRSVSAACFTLFQKAAASILRVP